MKTKQIDIIGIGIGENSLTIEITRIIQNSTLIIGATRMVESVSALNSSAQVLALIDSNKIYESISSSTHSDIVVLMSGDTGFHSGATKLFNLLEHTDFIVNVHAGISSIQYLASKINRPWNGVNLVSAHGVDCNIIGEVLTHTESVFLVGGEVTPTVLVNSLVEAGFTDLTFFIGENLGSSNEKISTLTPSAPLEYEFSSLAVVWVVRPTLLRDNYSGMLGDDDFIRGKVPITKSTVRNHVISLLGRNNSNNVIYDVGAGTGSIAIELALANPFATIYAFENNATACALITQNREKFNAYNLILVEGTAPSSFEGIPAPNKVFIGGSKGNMCDIFDAILERNSTCYFVVSAIAIETFAITINIFKEKHISNFDVTQIFVAKNKSVGGYNMLMGENPTFVISGGVLFT